VYLLRGANWARWLALVWIAYHVIISGFHSLHELVIHSLLFAVFAYFLFRGPESRYFHAARTEPGADGRSRKSKDEGGRMKDEG
jgi:hypothetical protein